MESRPNESRVDWQKRRSTIAVDALPLYLERPWPNVSIDEIAARLNVSYWKIYYSFDGQEDIYRATVSNIVKTITATPPFDWRKALSVSQSIHEYVRYTARIVSSDMYQKLLFLCLRDQHTDPWVKSTYEQKIAEPLRQGLEDAVVAAGARSGIDLCVMHGERERYLTMLEAALTLPKLLRQDDFVASHFESIIASTAKHVFSATCTFDGFGESAAAA